MGTGDRGQGWKVEWIPMQGLGGSGHLAMMDLDILGTASAMAVLAKYGVEGCGSPLFLRFLFCDFLYL